MEVTLHDDRALYLQLANAGLVPVGEPDFDARAGLANRADLAAVGACDGNDRRTLGETVALDKVDVKLPEALEDVLGARCAAGYHIAKPAAELLEDHVHDRAPDVHGKERARDLRGIKAFLYLVVELLAKKRHGAKDRRLEKLHVARDRPERLNELHLAPDEERPEEVRREAERVEERKDGEEAVVLAYVRVEGLERPVDVADEVPVREHRALGLARRTGSVDDRGNVLLAGHMRVIPRTAARNAELVEPDDLDFSDVLPLVDDTVDADNAPELRQLRREAHHHLEVVDVGRHHDGLGICENVLDLGIVELGVKRHDRDPRARLGEICLKPSWGIPEDYSHVLLARLQVEARSVALGDVAHAGEVLPPRATHPRLVFAPDERVTARPLRDVLFKQSANCHVMTLCCCVTLYHNLSQMWQCVAPRRSHSGTTDGTPLNQHMPPFTCITCRVM